MEPFKKPSIEVLLMSTHNVCFCGELIWLVLVTEAIDNMEPSHQALHYAILLIHLLATNTKMEEPTSETQGWKVRI